MNTLVRTLLTVLFLGFGFGCWKKPLSSDFEWTEVKVKAPDLSMKSPHLMWTDVRKELRRFQAPGFLIKDKNPFEKIHYQPIVVYLAPVDGPATKGGKSYKIVGREQGLVIDLAEFLSEEKKESRFRLSFEVEPSLRDHKQRLVYHYPIQAQKGALPCGAYVDITEFFYRDLDLAGRVFSQEDGAHLSSLLGVFLIAGLSKDDAHISQVVITDSRHKGQPCWESP